MLLLRIRASLLARDRALPEIVVCKPGFKVPLLRAVIPLLLAGGAANLIGNWRQYVFLPIAIILSPSDTGVPEMVTCAPSANFSPSTTRAPLLASETILPDMVIWAPWVKVAPSRSIASLLTADAARSADDLETVGLTSYRYSGLA